MDQSNTEDSTKVTPSPSNPPCVSTVNKRLSNGSIWTVPTGKWEAKMTDGPEDNGDKDKEDNGLKDNKDNGPEDKKENGLKDNRI